MTKARKPRDLVDRDGTVIAFCHYHGAGKRYWLINEVNSRYHCASKLPAWLTRAEAWCQEGPK